MFGEVSVYLTVDEYSEVLSSNSAVITAYPYWFSSTFSDKFSAVIENDL